MTSQPACSLEGCGFSDDGTCLLGNGVGCPNLAPAAATSSTTGADGLVVPASLEGLYSGNPLEIEEAREFTRRARAIVVVLVGLAECGKTSLIARLYQLFSHGQIGTLSFAGSRTLLRLEELSWLASIESGVGSPLMERTSRRFDNSLLHLAVQQAGCRLDVLINDVSGETVRDAVEQQSVCDGLQVIQRADHVVAFLDGGALASDLTSHDHVSKVRDFMRRLVQAGQIGAWTSLHVVVSKMDLAKERQEFAAKQEGDFRRLFSADVGEMFFWQIAARPHDGSLPTESTISDMFARWVMTPHRDRKPTTSPSAARAVTRDYCRVSSKND